MNATVSRLRAVARIEVRSAASRSSSCDHARVVARGGLMRLSSVDEAILLRRHWMNLAGLDQDEFLDSLRYDPPFDPKVEFEQIRAYFELQKATPPSELLSQAATRY